MKLTLALLLFALTTVKHAQEDDECWKFRDRTKKDSTYGSAMTLADAKAACLADHGCYYVTCKNSRKSAAKNCHLANGYYHFTHKKYYTYERVIENWNCFYDRQAIEV